MPKKPSVTLKLPALVTKNKGGRPHKLIPNDRTLELVRTIAGFQSTTREAAAHLKVAHQTFLDFKKQNPEVNAAWETGKQNGLMSLRVNQFKLAQRSPSMAIFLGKNYLNQRDIFDLYGTMKFEGIPTEALTKKQVIEELHKRGLPTTIYGVLEEKKLITIRPDDQPASVTEKEDGHARDGHDVVEVRQGRDRPEDDDGA